MNDIPRIRLVTPDSIQTPDDIRAGVGAVDTSVLPSDEQVLKSLVANNGIPVRVSACLNVSEEYVLSVAIKNPRVLSTMMRARLMMDSFTTMIKMNVVIQANLDAMPADALGRTYAATLAAFTNLAGQFEEQQTVDESDDAEFAKNDILDRLTKMGKREEAERVLSADENVG